MNVSPVRKIAFLLGSSLEDVLHTTTIAEDLARLFKYDVVVFYDNSDQVDLAKRVIKSPLPATLTFVPSQVSRYLQEAPLGWSSLPFVSKSLKELASFSAIVSPHPGLTRLRKRGLRGPWLIRAGRGASESESEYSKLNGKLDFMLMAGSKQQRRSLHEGITSAGKFELVGYPKFDAANRIRRDLRPPFANDLPIVLYSTASYKQSALARRSIKDHVNALIDSNCFNVILLLKNYDTRTASSDRALNLLRDSIDDSPHLHIDQCEITKLDMTHLRHSDILITDGGADPYEFAGRPRPIVFERPSKRYWTSNPSFNYLHLGLILKINSNIVEVVHQAIADHQRLQIDQGLAYRDTFYFDTSSTASFRAAAAISRLVLQET